MMAVKTVPIDDNRAGFWPCPAWFSVKHGGVFGLNPDLLLSVLTQLKTVCRAAFFDLPFFLRDFDDTLIGNFERFRLAS